MTNKEELGSPSPTKTALDLFEWIKCYKRDQALIALFDLHKNSVKEWLQVCSLLLNMTSGTREFYACCELIALSKKNSLSESTVIIPGLFSLLRSKMKLKKTDALHPDAEKNEGPMQEKTEKLSEPYWTKVCSENPGLACCKIYEI
jgi:hypothetical protein